MDKIIRKEYTVNIVIPKRILFFRINKVIKLNFLQATLRETLMYGEYVKGDSNRSMLRICDFIRKHGDKKLRYDDIVRIIINAQYILSLINKTYFYLGDKVSPPPTGEKGTEGAPYVSYLLGVAKELNIDPISLVKSYTQEQINNFVVGLCWNSNEITDEGKERNRLWVAGQKNKEMVEENKDKIDAIFNKLLK